MASYRTALHWLALNTDTSWLDHGDGITTEAALVADLFEKDDERVKTDLRKVCAQHEEEGRISRKSKRAA